MKNSFVLLICSASVALAQVPSTQPSQNPTYPGQAQQNYAYPRGAINNQPGVGGAVFTNRMGQSYSANDLAMQLQNLRSAVDATLPLLNAFNETYSNSVTGGRETVGGALSGIVSDVFHRHQQTGQNGASGQSSFGATNLLALLHGLLNTNTAGATGAAPANAEDLKILETDLQPVVSVLQRLNVSPAPAPYQTQTPYNSGVAPMPNPGQPISPTGR